MKPDFAVCYGTYSEKNEDRTPLNKPGWIPIDNSTKLDELFRLCPKPWRYQKPGETDSVPKWGQFSAYPGGGFVADLGYGREVSLSIIETLQKHGWLDRRSRAIILEFAAFNPSTNLLVVGTYFYEIQPSGHSAPLERLKIIAVYSRGTGSHEFRLVCVLVLIIFVLCYMGRIFYRVFKLRLGFFKSFWNWVEIFQVVVSVTAVVMNIIRSAKAVSTVRKLQENIYANVSFQEVIAWKEGESGVLGILVFIVTMKLLRLIRFNEHVAVFSKTLKLSVKLLRSYVVVLGIGFMAFLHFGILIFGTGSERYSSFLKATYFQLELILGRVKARPINELSDANATFGRVFAALLLISLTIMFMNFLIAAINDALSEAKGSVVKNELYDHIDERNYDNETNKKFFDAISKILKQRAAKRKYSRPHDKGAEKRTKKFGTMATVDLDLKGKAITVSRKNRNYESTKRKPNNTKRKSFYDRVSGALRRCRHAPDTKIITKLQLKRLWKKEEELFNLLDNIFQGYKEEEETFLSISRIAQHIYYRPRHGQCLHLIKRVTKQEAR